jgi:hypothetical protein
MSCYPLFKVISMSRVIGIIGTPQNVNPETHFLSLLAPSLLELLEQSPLICSEPFDMPALSQPFILRPSSGRTAESKGSEPVLSLTKGRTEFSCNNSLTIHFESRS